MANLIDPEFEAWLRNLTKPEMGYDRDWIQRNIRSLQQRFQRDPNDRMPPCPPAPEVARDRYEEI